MASLAHAPPDFLRPRAAEVWRPGLLLALGAHALLVLSLIFSVQWRTATPDVVEAEMWSQIPTVASSREPAPPPAQPPVPPVREPVKALETPPEPAAKPAPPKEVRAVQPPKPRPAPRPSREVFMPDPPEVKQKLEVARSKVEPPKVAEPVEPPAKAEPKPAPAPKPEAVPKASQAQVKAPTTPVTPPVAAPSKQDLEKARQDNLKRMMDKLSEDRLQTAGPTAEYAGRIKARVKPNIVFTAEITGNPLAVVEVRCAPDGRIISRKMIVSSGVPAWDDAVIRAIDRTEVLPLNEQGKVPTPLQLEFRPKDF